ncbi:MAG: hypothetical protein AAGC53_14270 [Actinomycetota bacterium]
MLYPLREEARYHGDLRGDSLDWTRVLELIEWVDGVRSDQLYLEGDSDGTSFALSVEGGTAGEVALGLRVSRGYYNLTVSQPRSEGAEWVWIPSGGVRHAVPRHLVVRRDSAVSAVRRFATEGLAVLDADEWERFDAEQYPLEDRPSDSMDPGPPVD